MIQTTSVPTFRHGLGNRNIRYQYDSFSVAVGTRVKNETFDTNSQPLPCSSPASNDGWTVKTNHFSCYLFHLNSSCGGGQAWRRLMVPYRIADDKRFVLSLNLNPFAQLRRKHGCHPLTTFSHATASEAHSGRQPDSTPTLPAFVQNRVSTPPADVKRDMASCPPTDTIVDYLGKHSSFSAKIRFADRPRLECPAPPPGAL